MEHVASMHDQQQEQQADWAGATSPTPPDWMREHPTHGKLRVDPVIHSRVRVLPATHCLKSSSDRAVDNQVDESDDDDDDLEYNDNESDTFEGNNNNSNEESASSGPSARFSHLPQHKLVAPEPRRVVSPELIFSSAAERCVH